MIPLLHNYIRLAYAATCPYEVLRRSGEFDNASLLGSHYVVCTGTWSPGLHDGAPKRHLLAGQAPRGAFSHVASLPSSGHLLQSIQ
jgi:hypothetical protein